MSLTWSGYNTSKEIFISETISKIIEMQDANTEQIFDQVKEKMLLDFKNFYFNQTYRQIVPRFNTIMRVP